MDGSISEALTRLGDRSRPGQIRPLSGGCINQAFYVQTGNSEYFVKTNERAGRDFFQKEAEGLRLLGNAQAIQVPNVYGYFYFEETETSVLVLEWVEGNKNSRTEEQLGRGVAGLHQTYGGAFGLEADNYIGSLPQVNQWQDDWIAFYREQRLGVQAALAEQQGYMHPGRFKKLQKLMDRLEEWLPDHVKPSLIHGDLWSGNWITGPGGEPYLIDPAVCFAHFELELAFTELFGGFSEKFYRAYDEVNPVSEGYQDRKQLYQLYYLLVHLNVFGESYGSAVDRVLEYYV
ncbi:fructosamine kinase family protein [Lihuaxuella thermophila]|uniref:Fructosamine-3-kinase n=1 Tax=Lihuaxuella thermophila TaxID=1173111 RepID=A0A1H8D1U4_9BACL|nr:fructosamine kinase family protein [Lihuaxuella thermophila]SEN00467.1 Fructosamine-3-kinase [Lihuaxuella thermophila]